MSWVGCMLIGLGVICLLIASLGAFRLPDFYTRAHAVGVMDSLGALLVVTGLASFYITELLALKLFLLAAFVFVANPTITHILTRAAFRSGLKPYTRDDPDGH